MPTVYVAEPVPPEIVKTLLDKYWNDMNGKVPKPELWVLNVPTEAPVEEVGDKDYVLISTDAGGEEEKLRDAWCVKDMKFSILLELATMVDRQRLYDIKKIIRGIIHTNIHNQTVTQFHIIRYVGFRELVADTQNVWKGLITMTFESNGVPLDTL